MIVSLEDSTPISLLLRKVLRPILGKMPLKEHQTLMSAAIDIPKAAGVIIDWTLLDGVNAMDAGVLELLQKKGIPHVIFTASPDSVPDTVSCQVISKSEIGRLIAAVEAWLQESQTSAP